MNEQPHPANPRAWTFRRVISDIAVLLVALLLISASLIGGMYLGSLHNGTTPSIPGVSQILPQFNRNENAANQTVTNETATETTNSAVNDDIENSAQPADSDNELNVENSAAENTVTSDVPL